MAGTSGKASATDRKPGNAADKPSMPPVRTWLIFFILLVLNYFLVTTLFPERDAPVPVSYSLFRSELARDNVEAIHTQGESIEGKFKSAVAWTPPAAAGAPSRASAAYRLDLQDRHARAARTWKFG